jgi:hypothetical protein
MPRTSQMIIADKKAVYYAWDVELNLHAIL